MKIHPARAEFHADGQLHRR